jgi:hypothetical protein
MQVGRVVDGDLQKMFHFILFTLLFSAKTRTRIAITGKAQPSVMQAL